MPTYGDGSCNTLTADYHSPAICLQTDHLGQNGTNAHVGVSKTLDTQGAPAVAYAVRMHEGKAGGGKGPLVQTDISGTIATGNDQTILCKAETQFGEEIAGTLTARADGSPCVDRGQNVVFCRAGDAAGAETCRNMSPTLMAHCEKGAPLLVHRNETPSPARDEPHEDESHATIHDGSSWVVRRLTPIECERLQGFPDGWTDLTGCDADAVAEKVAASLLYDEKQSAALLRKVRKWSQEHPSDTPRYKACGNSMAVPVMRWIGSRIQMVQKITDEMG